MAVNGHFQLCGGVKLNVPVKSIRVCEAKFLYLNWNFQNYGAMYCSTLHRIQLTIVAITGFGNWLWFHTAQQDKERDGFERQFGLLLSSEFGRRCQVQSCARHWLQLVGCAALLLDASNFGGPDGVGESGVELRRSLRRREQVKEK